MAKTYLDKNVINNYLYNEDDSEPELDLDDDIFLESEDDISLGSDEDEYVPPLSRRHSSDDDDSDMDVHDSHQAPITSSSTTLPDPTAVSPISSSPNDDWTDTPDPNPLHFTFGEDIGMNTDVSSVEDFADLFLPEEFLQMLVEQTNIYASQEINKNGPLRRSSRMKFWKPTNVGEMKVFWGLFLHMGPFTLPSLDLYWSKDILYESTLWSSVMSRYRFQLLPCFFHFADNSVESDDRLHKIRILNHFNGLMKRIYVPEKNICIDESMMLWRGRLSFRQYIKNKKHKYGIALYNLCESNGLVIKTKIYCGKRK